MLMRMCLVACLILGSVNKSNADVITGWNFNSVTPDANTTTGTNAASVGTGTASVIGGTTASFATGAGTIGGTDNSGWNITTFAAQGTGSGTRGVQFTGSTAGFTNITLDMDLRMSGTASRFFQLQATSDGTTYSNVSGGVSTGPNALNNNTAATMSSSGLIQIQSVSGGQQFVEGFRYRFASNSLLENNANFGFRLVAVFDPVNGSTYSSSFAGTPAAYGTTGTFRLDNIAISGVPEPTSIALLSVAGVAGLAASYRRRKAKKSAAV